MPNAVNYNVSAQTQALKKGNFWIATGDVGKGSGYWNGISPPLSGYTIYLNKASNGPAIYTVSTEAQLTGLTSTIAGQTLTTSGACLNWFATQTDKMILNKDYNNIVTNGLVLSLDAGFTPSYPTTGTTWYDNSPSGNNGTLTNGPTFNSANDGLFIFDGTNDYVEWSTDSYVTPSLVSWWNLTSRSFEMLVNFSNLTFGYLFGVASTSDFETQSGYVIATSKFGIQLGGGNTTAGSTLSTNTWYQMVWVRNSSSSNTLFINGTQIGTISQAINDIQLGYDWQINMMRGGDFGNYKQGSVPIFRLYNRALSTTEVLQNYLATINPKFIFGFNLKIWYDMSLQPSEASVDNVNTIDSSNNLVTLSRVYDLSGNGKHLLQTTKVNQPTFIPNAQNGRPANYNTGGNWYDADATVMQTSSNALTSGARSFFIVLKGAANSAFSWDRDSSHPGSLQLGYSSINGWNDLTQDASVNIGGGNSTTTYVMSYLLDTNQTLLYRNGNLNRSQSNNTYTISTGVNSRFGCWTTAPSAGNQEGYWYEMVFLNKIPTITEYNALVTYLGTKWGVSCGTLTNYN
jgi:hypothetical protein